MFIQDFNDRIINSTPLYIPILIYKEEKTLHKIRDGDTLIPEPKYTATTFPFPIINKVSTGTTGKPLLNTVYCTMERMDLTGWGGKVNLFLTKESG